LFEDLSLGRAYLNFLDSPRSGLGCTGLCNVVFGRFSLVSWGRWDAGLVEIWHNVDQHCCIESTG